MTVLYVYSCGLSTATIEYSCPSVCLCVCVHDNSKNNGSIHLKLEPYVPTGYGVVRVRLTHRIWCCPGLPD